MTTIEERILVPETTDQFLWIVVVGVLGAFFAAYGIGANDVANAFATSVGAKAITLRQAVVFAGIFEFLGALLLGSHVTETIRSGIADVSMIYAISRLRFFIVGHYDAKKFERRYRNRNQARHP